MNDLTILYYTANYVADSFAKVIRDDLVKQSKRQISIISVSQAPIDLGKNICVGNIGRTHRNLFTQILIGAKEATTDYVVCCEDDSLYNWEHFSYRPKDAYFAYNINRWNLNSDMYYQRNRAGMCMNISYRKKLIESIEDRFSVYPDRDGGGVFCEPGRHEKKFKVKIYALEKFRTKIPTLTVNHRDSMGSKKAIMKSDVLKNSVYPWGKAENLWKRLYE